MDHDAFRDYCKAENSEDEEVNHDLQSRLYAEIYYGPSDIETIDIKPNIKYENVITDNETGQENENIAPNDNLSKDNYGTNHLNSGHSSTVTEKDDKTSIKLIVTANQIGTSHKDVNNQSKLPSVKSVEHFVGNVKSVNSNIQSMPSNDVENVKNSLNCQNALPERNIAEAERESESKEHLKSLQCLNPETPVSESSCNNTETTQELASTKTELNDDNILKKYDYLKMAINKLYIKKYVDLEEKLQRIEEDNERCLKEAECKRNGENEQQQQSNTVNQTNTESGNDIVGANEGTPKMSDDTETIMISSETESNSEDSILEVPIPPKPQPPVINLNDSDDSSDLCSSSDSGNEELPTIIECANDTLQNITDKSDKGEKSLDTNTANEDIVLNCTDIQKCATSIQEIIDTSKSVQSSSACNETELGILYYPFSDDENTQNFYIPPKPTARSNFVYERDKQISFTEDIVLSNRLKSNESTSNKRRHNESDNERCSNVEQTENRCHENKRSKINHEEHTNRDKNDPQRWQEYFFRPMSDNVKNFYNESRGQENFDIKEIQNNMSKDPRLWTILDEDLMPGINRHRYWNSKNNYCHYAGRQKHNYPELSKPPRCHMCGSEGHTEARCPEKMCLTCGKKQGTFRKTCESCRILYCSMCAAVGHKSTECPDLWRRFHQTTQNSEINIPDNLSEVMKPADLLYCCNCTKRGHDSSTCNEYRWSQHFPTPAYVSNYTDGPEYENSEPRAVSSKSEDIILLSNTKKHKCKTFQQGQENLEGCFVVYSYGEFYTKSPNGEEVKKNLIGDQIHASQLTNFFKGRVVPSFLDKLRKIVNFEIKIYYDEKRVLMTRVRSTADAAPRICDIFMFWLKLPDEDKHLEICVTFPRSRRKLLRYLNTKLGELQNDLNDPDHLCDQIMRLSTTMSNAKDALETAAVSKKLLNLRGKLMKVFHTKPKMSDSVIKLKKLMKSLAANQKCQIEIPLYLNIVLVYNRIFIPRKLTDSELTRFRKSYYKGIQKADTKRRKKEEKEESRKQKAQKYDPYETFLQNLRSHNEKKNKMNTPPNVANNDATQSTRSSEKNNKQTSTVISANVTNPVKDNVQCNINTDGNTKNTCVENPNTKTNTNQSSAVHSIERIQLPRNENVPYNSEAIDTIEKASSAPSDTVILLPKLADLVKQSKINMSNLVTVPIKDKELPEPPKSSNVSCPEVRPPQNNTEKSSGTTSTNSETVENPNSKQDEAGSSSDNTSKKKKSKKSKKRKLDENNSQVTENQAINPILLNKANVVISEALGFNLPYMNKAVDEVRKRINDARLKQEHIDVLQRLINLENDHQKYVSSFCNYLQ